MRGKVLLLRLFRIGRLPSALHGGQILQERGVPVLALEFGGQDGPRRVWNEFPRLRWPARWSGRLPRRWRALVVFFATLVRLLWHRWTGDRPTLVIAHGLQEQCLAAALKWLGGVRYGVHVHEAFTEGDLSPLNRVFLRWEGFCLRHADFLVFPEMTRARLLRKRYAFDTPVHVAYNCPRRRQTVPPFERLSFGIPSDARVMLYIGGIGDNNYLDEGIESIAAQSDLHFLLAGWSEPRTAARLRNLATRLGCLARVHFLGEVDETTKWALLCGADFGYCLYRPATIRLANVATASNKVMECVAAGLPILVSDNPDFYALITRFEIGVCTAPDAKSIAGAVFRLASDEALRARLSRNARTAHTQQLNYDYQFRAIAELVDSYHREPGTPGLVPWKKETTRSTALG